jgi:predicted RNA-binding Zn-ribbon protein involved in translation (DUF1610 family)
MIRVTFACGHVLADVDASQDAPVCPECGERRIVRVNAPQPKFRGVATGPLCEEAPKGN